MTLDPGPLTQNPFAVITIIAAPAILTNASSILTLSTSTRLMRCLDRINQLTEKLDRGNVSDELKKTYLRHVELSHRQSQLFLSALRGAYLTLACFAMASFGSLFGAAIASFVAVTIVESVAVASLLAGGVGVFGLLWASYCC